MFSNLGSISDADPTTLIVTQLFSLSPPFTSVQSSENCITLVDCIQAACSKMEVEVARAMI